MFFLERKHEGETTNITYHEKVKGKRKNTQKWRNLQSATGSSMGWKKWKKWRKNQENIFPQIVIWWWWIQWQNQLKHIQEMCVLLLIAWKRKTSMLLARGFCFINVGEHVRRHPSPHVLAGSQMILGLGQPLDTSQVASTGASYEPLNTSSVQDACPKKDNACLPITILPFFVVVLLHCFPLDQSHEKETTNEASFLNLV